MKLMIDISEEDYKRVSTIVDMGLGTNIDEAIKNGIPLENANNGEIFNKVFDSTFMFVNMCADDRMRNWLNACYKENKNETDN